MAIGYAVNVPMLPVRVKHNQNIEAGIACSFSCSTCRAEMRYGRGANWPIRSAARVI